HRTPDRTYRLGAVNVADEPADVSLVAEFETLHHNTDLVDERARVESDRQRAPDKTLMFWALMPILYGDSEPTTASSWVCPMHPEVVSSEPGTCPKCGMKLIPADGAEAMPAAADNHAAMHMHDSGDGL